MASKSKQRAERIDQVLDAGRQLGAAAVLYHSAIAEHLGLGPTDTKVLDLLEQHGPVTPKDLGELTGMAPASITAIADRLESKQLLVRRPHPSDGRRVLLASDPTAYERLAPLYNDLVERLSQYYETLDDDALDLARQVFIETASRQAAAAKHITQPNIQNGPAPTVSGTKSNEI